MAVLAWTIAASLPLLAFDDVDDAFFLEVSNLWSRGMAPFVASFDVKGLGFYALLALAEQPLGVSLLTIKIVSILSSAAGAYLLSRICARYDASAARVCAGLYPVVAILAGDAAYQTMNAVLLMAFFAAFSDGPLRRRAIVSGLCLGLACMIKQTSAIDAMALLYILATYRRDHETLRALAVGFFASAAVAPVAFLLVYAARGEAAPLVHDYLFAASHRLGAVNPVTVGLYLLRGFEPLLLVAIACVPAALDRSLPDARAPRRALCVWLSLELVGLLAQGAALYTYFVPLLAPMLLLATLHVSAFCGRDGRRRRIEGLAFLFAASLLCAWATRGLMILQQMRVVERGELQETVAAVLGAHPSQEDRLLVLNGPVWPNIATGLVPPTPYYYWMHIMCPFNGAGLAALAGNFDARPRFVVFENPTKHLRCETEDFKDLIQRRLSADYVLAAVSHGAQSEAEVYERRR